MPLMSNVRALVHTRSIAFMHYGLRKALRIRFLLVSAAPRSIFNCLNTLWPSAALRTRFPLVSRCTALPRSNASTHFGPRWPPVLAFSCSRAIPRCTRQHRAPGQRARRTGLGQFASATPGERHRRLAPRGILEPVLTREANPQERLEPVGSLKVLRSGAL